MYFCDEFRRRRLVPEAPCRSAHENLPHVEEICVEVVAALSIVRDNEYWSLLCVLCPLEFGECVHVRTPGMFAAAVFYFSKFRGARGALSIFPTLLPFVYAHSCATLVYWYYTKYQYTIMLRVSDIAGVNPCTYCCARLQPTHGIPGEAFPPDSHPIPCLASSIISSHTKSLSIALLLLFACCKRNGIESNRTGPDRTAG